MRHLLLVCLACVIATFVACGGGESSTTGEDSTVGTEGSSTTASTESRPTKPSIVPPDSMPDELVIEDQEEGSGPPAKTGDQMTMEFLAVDDTGKPRFSSWGKGKPALIYKLGTGEFFPAWDEAVSGMKAGGRREIIVPTGLSGGWGPLIYVVDLLKIEPAARSSSG